MSKITRKKPLKGLSTPPYASVGNIPMTSLLNPASCNFIVNVEAAAVMKKTGKLSEKDK